MSTLEAAGAERVALNLAEYFSETGLKVDLVLVQRRGALLQEVPLGIRVIDLKARRALTAIVPFRRYLKKARPSAVLAINFEVNITAAAASMTLVRKPKLILSVHAAPSAVLRNASTLRAWQMIAASKVFYPFADAVVTVSQGAADELRALGWCDSAKIVTIYNPVIRKDFDDLARAPANHPWVKDMSVPLVIGVARLTAQKDFLTLLSAFAQVAKRRTARLMIIGEGEERPLLERAIVELGLTDCAVLAGHIDNPLPYMRRADLFVLSSAYEGFGNVLVEAMAAGTSIVSTDCPHGPNEILEGGKWGILVPPGSPTALADAICAALGSGKGKGRIRSHDFTVESAGDQYLSLLT